MLKRDITYTNFDDVEVTETFYFNISKQELLKLESEYPEGIAKAFEKIGKGGDNAKIYETFRNFVLRSYGERSEDGKTFKKTPEITEEFSHTAAFDQLLWEIGTDANKAVTFLQGVLPKEFAGKIMQQDKPIGPPPQRKAVAPPLPPTAR